MNKSLSALGAVITALIHGSAHVPYRNCKVCRSRLWDARDGCVPCTRCRCFADDVDTPWRIQLTRVLEPCLNGSSKTLMILTVADAPVHRDTNMHCLRFGASMASVVVKKASDKDIRAAKKALLALQ